MKNAFEIATLHYDQWLLGIATVSIIFLLISILFIPFLIARIPSDYFVQSRQPLNSHARSWRSLIWLILRNIVGTLLILAGAAMLVLPGQGILTMLAGLFIMDFPGKFKLERYLIGKPIVLHSVNWIRRQQNCAEIQIK